MKYDPFLRGQAAGFVLVFGTLVLVLAANGSLTHFWYFLVGPVAVFAGAVLTHRRSR